MVKFFGSFFLTMDHTLFDDSLFFFAVLMLWFVQPSTQKQYNPNLLYLSTSLLHQYGRLKILRLLQFLTLFFLLYNYLNKPKIKATISTTVYIQKTRVKAYFCKSTYSTHAKPMSNKVELDKRLSRKQTVICTIIADLPIVIGTISKPLTVALNTGRTPK